MFIRRLKLIFNENYQEREELGTQILKKTQDTRSKFINSRYRTRAIGGTKS